MNSNWLSGYCLKPGAMSRNIFSSVSCPVEMGVWGHNCDLEGPSLRSLLEESMCSADACIRAPKNDDILHLSRCRAWIRYLSKVISSEKLKDNSD